MKKITIIFIILILSAAFTFLFAGCNPSTQPSDIVNSYDLSLSYDKNSHTLSGGMRFYFVNECEEEISFLLFNLHANAYREGASYPAVAKEYSSSAYPNGKSYGNISITSVKTDDSALNYEICGEDKNLLKVHLSAPLEQGNNVTVEIMYSVKLANVRHRLGYTNRSVNLGNFYPILCYMENNAFCEYPYYNLGDPFVSECANYNVTLICPESYHVAHSGSKISEQKIRTVRLHTNSKPILSAISLWLYLKITKCYPAPPTTPRSIITTSQTPKQNQPLSSFAEL